MIPFPPVSPVIFQISIGGLTLALRWYALAYIAGLLIAWALMRRAIRTPRLWTNAPPLTIEQLEQHIKESGSLMATALMQYELSGCFAARGQADGYRIAMEALINGRSAAQAQTLEVA